MKSWKKWLRLLGACAGILMALVAVAGFFLPASLVVQRERLIPFPAPDLYDRVAALNRWPEWAVWWQREPFLETEFSGPPAGAGATVSWRSKSEGAGRARITAVSPSTEIALAFDFGERGDARSTLRFEENTDRTATLVRWTVRSDFGGNTGRRYFGLLFRHAVETDLDQSLANLETAARTRSSPLPPAP